MKAREIEIKEECVRLNREIERWRTATAKMLAAMEESGRVANEQLARAEKRVAELEAALPEVIAMAEAWQSTDGEPATEFVRRLKALARAEFPAPAKHPDFITVLRRYSDWRKGTIEGHCPIPVEDVTEAIDAALLTLNAKHPDTVLTPAQFLEAVAKLGEVNGYSLAHEDCHGAFLVENFTPGRKEWLLGAWDNTAARKQGGAK